MLLQSSDNRVGTHISSAEYRLPQLDQTTPFKVIVPLPIQPPSTAATHCAVTSGEASAPKLFIQETLTTKRVWPDHLVGGSRSDRKPRLPPTTAKTRPALRTASLSPMTGIRDIHSFDEGSR